jgi:hypothetical protein
MIKRLTFILFLSSLYTFGQIEEKTYTLNANYGVAATPSANINNGQHIELGVTYMSDNLFQIENDRIWGLKLDLGFDKFRKGEKSNQIGTNLYRVAAQGVCNLSNLIIPAHFRYYDNFNTMVHVGVGLSINQKIEWLSKGFGLNNYFTKQTEIRDRIGFIILGLTPKYNLTEAISINIDVTTLINFKQQLNSDGLKRNNKNPNMTYDLSAGISYIFR